MEVTHAPRQLSLSGILAIESFPESLHLLREGKDMGTRTGQLHMVLQIPGTGQIPTQTQESPGLLSSSVPSADWEPAGAQRGTTVE